LLLSPKSLNWVSRAAVRGWAWRQKLPTGIITVNSVRRTHMSTIAFSTGVVPNIGGSG
jgi:hypothetical protein